MIAYCVEANFVDRLSMKMKGGGLYIYWRLLKVGWVIMMVLDGYAWGG